MEVKKRRGRPPKIKVQQNQTPIIIDFGSLTTLDNLDIDSRMLETMPSGIDLIDEFISHEGGVPCSTNIMVIGDPGVGKTSILLDALSSIEKSGRKCLFISGEMGRKQMFKYTKRFKQFGCVTTLFLSDFLEFNSKDVIEQVLNKGYDCILIDSVAEVVDGVRDDNKWDRKTAESWLVDTCVKNNKGENIEKKFSSFLLIQQVTKAGEFVGSNKLKHMTDAMLEMRKESDKDGGGTYLEFTKNRNGSVNQRLSFSLMNSKIEYGMITGIE
jgi:DNA repair protein RadA/Sms|tara:strand:+ start:566 stop:1375 length:810 start_codon:yes stop_codon:yes gene_type:complete